MNDGIKTSLTKVTHGRPSGEVEWYSPARDISVLVPALISEALKDWDSGKHAEYLNILNRLGRREKEIERVAEALAAYISEDSILNTSSHEDALFKSGLVDIPAEIRMPVMATIAEEVISALWYAVRSATTSQDAEGNYVITQYDPKAVARVAKETTSILRMPKWKRKIVKKWWNFKEMLRRKLFSKGDE